MREDDVLRMAMGTVVFPDDFKGKKCRRVTIWFSEWQSSREILQAVFQALIDKDIYPKDWDVK